MIEIASARINSFGPSPKVGFVSPSDQLISLSYGQLQELIRGAVEQALQPLQDEVTALRVTVARQGEEIASLRAKLTLLESTQEQDANRICLDIAYDRQRLAKLEHPTEEPTNTEKERVERIEKLCTDAPNHEISLSEIRGRLGIDKSVLSRLLRRINGDRFYLRKSMLDKRIRYLCLRPVVR